MFSSIIPADTIVLIASSTLTSRYLRSFFGIIKRNPEVGLGVVGIKTLTRLFLSFFLTSPLTSPVVKPITHAPYLGYSTKTASLNACELVFIIVSRICFIVL